MTTPALKLYPSAPLEKDDLEQRLEKKLIDVNSLNISTSKTKRMITLFKDKIHKIKKKLKKLKC